MWNSVNSKCIENTILKKEIKIILFTNNVLLEIKEEKYEINNWENYQSIYLWLLNK
jgi:hypothetical protein